MCSFLFIIVFVPFLFVRSTKQIGLCGETGYPLCEMSVKNVELSEPKASFRCLVNKHLAGRLGTSALIFFCFVFLYQDKKMKWVWATPKTNILYTNNIRAITQDCSYIFVLRTNRPPPPYRQFTNCLINIIQYTNRRGEPCVRPFLFVLAQNR